MLNIKLQTVTIVMVFVLSCNGYIKSVEAVVYENLPTLNESISPVASENRVLLFKRLTVAFDQTYAPFYTKTISSTLADSYAAYYLRQQLQALIDMWRATGNADYLDKARRLSLKAIADASALPKPLLKYKQTRGVWPCFFSKDFVPFTGGHGQLYDFQCAAGLMMVAVALREQKHPDANAIADFVEQKIVTKWLQIDPAITRGRFRDNDSNRLLLAFLDSSRDKREHFACICMDLDKLGYSQYPYHNWARFLVQLYMGHRSNLNQAAPDKALLGNLAPNDWGVIANESTGGLLWYDGDRPPLLILQDTSHSNRTVWLAAHSYNERLIDDVTLKAFINTFKYQVWAPKKGVFYFNNIIDGNDIEVQSMGPGQKGNIWFGWHRLAAYDSDLKELFISIAYDLTNGGPNVIGQNKGMTEAPPCLIAWAARLISPNGNPTAFP